MDRITFANRTALRISLFYCFVAAFWIYYSDVAVAELLPAHLAPGVQTIKGTFFVVVTTVLLFGLIRRSLGREMATREARRESEHRWRELIGHSVDAVLLLDGGRIIYGNPAAADLVGAGGAHELRGRSVDELLFPSEEEVEEGLTRGRRSCKTSTIRRPDGSSRVVEDHSTSVRLGGRNVTLSILVDITSRVEFERMLMQAKEEAEMLAEVKEAILTNMSHEIRTPLTGILGLAEVIAEEVQEGPRELAELLQESGWRLMRTLDSILTLAQLESQGDSLPQEPVDLVETCTRIVGLFVPAAAEKEVDLEFEAPDEELFVLANPAALDQVVMNLVSNAVKFTHRGDVTVSITDRSESAVLEVEDTGIGICPEFLPQIYDEFRQESVGVDRSFEGSGLGMTIVKRLLEGMNGEILVKSEKNVGTTVRVVLPLIAEHPEPVSKHSLQRI